MTCEVVVGYDPQKGDVLCGQVARAYSPKPDLFYFGTKIERVVLCIYHNHYWGKLIKI